MQISREMLNDLLTSIRNGKNSILEAYGSKIELNLTPGTEIKGEVLARQPNGNYIVRINEELLDMPLPADSRIGTTVKMTYIGDTPRLTFAISSAYAKGSEVNLSNAGRWLGTLSASAQESTKPQSSVGTPLIQDSVPVDKADIVLKLREAVSKSGFFYESHLERWTAGSFPLPELLKEPQGQLSTLTKESAGKSTNLPESTFEPPDNQTIPVVKQQLEMLNTGQFIIQGEAWRGQNLEWAISRDKQGKNQQEERGWNTELGLNLPNLGAISASLTINGNKVNISIKVSDSATAEKLGVNRDQLLIGLESSGLELSGMEIRHEPKP